MARPKSASSTFGIGLALAVILAGWSPLSLRAEEPPSARLISGDEVKGASQPQIAVSPDGAIDVAYGSGNTIYFVRSTDEGATFTPPVKVADVPKLMLGMRRGPRIAASNERIVIIAPSTEEISLSSGDAGKTWNWPGPVSDKSGSSKEGLAGLTALPDGSFYAVWLDAREGSSQVEGARLTGSKWGGNVVVYRSPERTVCECCHPSVTASRDGKIAVMFRNFLGGNRDLYLTESTDSGATFSAAYKCGTGSWKLNACPMDGGALTFDATGEPYAVWRRGTDLFLTAPGQPEMRIDKGAQPVLARINGETAACWQNGVNLAITHSLGKQKPFELPGKYPALAASPDAKAGYLVWESPEGVRFERLQ